MMKVDEKREIIAVTLGAMAIALSKVIWHLGSDKETMLGLMRVVCKRRGEITLFTTR